MNIDPISYIEEIPEVLLTREDYILCQEVERRTFDEVYKMGKIRRFEDDIRRSMTYELRASIYGIDHGRRHVVRFPSNWWEALK